jgi:hypothetical protein
MHGTDVGPVPPFRGLRGRLLRHRGGFAALLDRCLRPATEDGTGGGLAP